DGNPDLAKQYIDWYFLEKVSKQKKKLSSMSVLIVPNIVSLFKHNLAKQRKITRSTKLPLPMLEWIKQNANSLFDVTQLEDFGDLQGLMNFAKKNRQSSGDLELF